MDWLESLLSWKTCVTLFNYISSDCGFCCFGITSLKICIKKDKVSQNERKVCFYYFESYKTPQKWRVSIPVPF